MSGNASQTGMSGFSIYYSRHQLTTPLGQWGYVGKAPPCSSTSSRDSSANSVSQTSLHTSQTFSAASRAPAMPPRARPVSHPIPGPEQPQALSQSSGLPPSVSLPTTFRFLRRDTIMLRYCRNVHPTWVKFNSKDTKESGVVRKGFRVLSPRRGLR